MYENIPLRKDFVYRVNTKNWFLDIEYKQATAIESIEFYNMDINEQLKNIGWIIENNSSFSMYYKNKRYRSKKWNIYKQEQKNKSILYEYIEKNGIDVINKISSTMHKTYTSIYKEINIPKEWRTKSIFQYDLMNICKWYNIGWVLELLNNYTLEQVGWLSDWLIFKAYEMDKKKWWINDRALFKKKWGLSKKEKDLLARLKADRKQRDLASKK